MPHVYKLVCKNWGKTVGLVFEDEEHRGPRLLSLAVIKTTPVPLASRATLISQEQPVGQLCMTARRRDVAADQVVEQRMSSVAATCRS